MEIKYGQKRKSIRKQLDIKLEEWIETIEDSFLQDQIRKDVIITGGSICSMAMGDKVNDYDVYFRTIQTTFMVADYYVKKFKELNGFMKTAVASCDPVVRKEVLHNIKNQEEERVVIYIKSAGVAGEEQKEYRYFESAPPSAAEEFAESLVADEKEGKPKYRPVFLSQNAITLSDEMQIVIRFYGEPKQIHDNYDFVHAMCYYDYATGALNMPAEALEAMMSRTLIYKGSLYPIASIFRAKKFIERGWRITAGQLLKIMWQISEIDMKDYNILREQLTGVDQAYMYQLVSALKDVDPEKINSAYITTIIDKVFE
jgi:hypothetical protein